MTTSKPSSQTGFPADFADKSNGGDGDDEWATPPSMWRPLARAVGGFDTDPASGAESTPIAPTRYTEADDGLSKPWHGNVWCNPPYSDPGPWLQKAISEVEAGNADTVLVLLPNNRLHTNYLQDALDHPASAGFVLCRGKQTFVKEGDSAPSPATFGTVLLLFGDVSQELERACESLGTLVTDGEVVAATEQQTISSMEER